MTEVKYQVNIYFNMINEYCICIGVSQGETSHSIEQILSCECDNLMDDITNFIHETLDINSHLIIDVGTRVFFSAFDGKDKITINCFISSNEPQIILLYNDYEIMRDHRGAYISCHNWKCSIDTLMIYPKRNAYIFINAHLQVSKRFRKPSVLIFYMTHENIFELPKLYSLFREKTKMEPIFSEIFSNYTDDHYPVKINYLNSSHFFAVKKSAWESGTITFDDVTFLH